MRIIVAGGRDFDDFSRLNLECVGVIKQLKNEGYNTRCDAITIVSGTARGADILGEKFANKYGLSVSRFPANWDKFGKSAGYIRNGEMAKFASEDSELGVLIAFWDTRSRGTKHMIDLSTRHGLKVFVINY